MEIHDEEEANLALESGARVIGVNNRDLRSFAVDLEHSIRMRAKVPLDSVLVAESGIECRADVLRLQSAGIEAMLVGESLMRAADIGRAVGELLGRGEQPCPA